MQPSPLSTSRGTSGSKLAATLIGAALSLTMPDVVHAQPNKATTADDVATTEARMRFEEGIKLADAGDHEAARLKFNQAWALLKSPAILYNLARAEQLSNHLVEALEHYRLFSKMSSDPKITDAQRQRVSENIAELSKKVGLIDVEAPPNARVSVDGKTVDSTHDPILVLPGKHTVEALVDGHVKSVTVDCQAGTVTKAKLMEPARAPAPALSPSARPVQAVQVGNTTPTEPPAEAPSNFWTTGRIVGTSVAAAGVVGLGLGVVFHLGASKSADDAETIRNTLPPPRGSACTLPANREPCAKLTTAVDDQHSKETLRTALFVGGGAFVLGGVVLFLVSPPKGEPTRGSVRVVPVATGRETGIGLVGRF